jgi:hypothetical protein
VTIGVWLGNVDVYLDSICSGPVRAAKLAGNSVGRSGSFVSFVFSRLPSAA